MAFAVRAPILTYLQCFISICCFSFSSEEKKNSIFGTGVVDVVLNERIESVRMGDAVRRRKGQTNEDKNK